MNTQFKKIILLCVIINSMNAAVFEGDLTLDIYDAMMIDVSAYRSSLDFDADALSYEILRDKHTVVPEPNPTV